jgi:ElaB/YqjD/DUF883 family membrane-anchored ribosome-binding protein
VQNERTYEDETITGPAGSAKTGWQDETSDETSGDVTGQAKEKAAEVATQVKDRAQETADKAIDGTAGGVQSVADTIRERAEGSGGIQEKAGTTVADGMEKTATYLRDHDSQQMMQDVERFVREHPTQAVLGAVAAGFIIGRILR